MSKPLNRAASVLIALAVVSALFVSATTTAQAQTVPTLTFSVSSLEVAESDGQAIITVTASPAPSSDFSAVVTVADNPELLIGIAGSAATFGKDYGTGSDGAWRVDFPAGIAEASFLVPITTDDAAYEGDETFELQINADTAAPARYRLGTIQTRRVTVTITDHVWSATLTPKSVKSDSALGCDNSNTATAKKCSTEATLSDDDFTVDGTTFTVNNLHLLNSNKQLHLSFSDTQVATLKDYTLRVGNATFPFVESTSSDLAAYWEFRGLTLRADRPVTARIWRTPAPGVPQNAVAAAFDQRINASWKSPESSEVLVSDYDVQYKDASAPSTGWINAGSTDGGIRHSIGEVIFDSTLTVNSASGSGTGPGCGGDASNRCALALSQASFVYGAKSYQVNQVSVTSGTLAVMFDTALPTSVNPWVLRVDDDVFEFSDGTIGTDRLSVRWDNTSLSWSSGDTVELELRTADLTNYSSYDVRVRAVSAAGAGPWSDPEKVVPAPTRLIWSTTLTSESIQATLLRGCAGSGRTACASQLENSQFTARGTDYNITEVTLRNDIQCGGPCPTHNELQFVTDVDHLTLARDFTLIVGGLHFPLIRAKSDTDIEHDLTAWQLSGLNWSDWRPGRTIELQLYEAITWPDPPTDLALEVGDAKLSATWRAPLIEGAAPLSGYDLEYKEKAAQDKPASTVGDPSTGWVDAGHNGTNPSAEITGLTNDTEYDVRVRAKNKIGVSDWATASGTPSKPTVTLAAAPNPVAEGSPVTVTVTVSRALASDVVVPLTVTLNTAEPSDITSTLSTVTISSGSTSTTATINTAKDTDSDDDTFTVALGTLPATVAAGTARSVLVTITDVDPGDPTDLGVVGGDRKLSLSWSAPSDAGAPGVSLTGYDVQHKTDAATDQLAIGSDPATGWVPVTHAGVSTTAEIASLTNGTTYDVRVRAKNAAGVSGWVSASGTPTKPVVSLLAAPDPVNEGSAVTVTVVFSVAPAGDVVLPLRVTADTAEPGDIGTLTSITVSSGSTVGTGEITTAHDADSEDEMFTVAFGALPPTVVAGMPASVGVTITDVDPGRPTGLGVSAGDAKLLLSWTAPVDAGAPGASLSGYDVQFKATDAADWSTNAHSGTTTTSEITGLSNGTTYDVRVRAKNAAGVSVWVPGSGTPSKPAVTLTATPNPVTEGESVTVTASLSRALVSNLVVPVTITLGSAESGDVGSLTSITINAGSMSATGDITTTRDVDFDDETFTVALGTLQSTVVASATALVLVTITDVDPGPPTGLDLVTGDTKLGVSWTAPLDSGAPGASLTGYDLQYKARTAADQVATGGDPATGWVPVTHAGVSTTAEITSLTNNTVYDVRVRARNAVGKSVWVTGSGLPVDPADASLRLLRVTRVDADSTVVPFTPRLSPSTSFTVRVGADVSEVNVLAVPTVADATVTINGTVGTSKVVSLDYGDNTIGVLVTATDGVTTKTYTITAKRAYPIPTIVSVVEGAVASSPAVTVVTANPDASTYRVVVQIKTASAASWPARGRAHSLPTDVTRASGTDSRHVFVGLVKGTDYLVRAHLVAKADNKVFEGSSSQKAFTAWTNPGAPGGPDTAVWSTTLNVNADNGSLGCENTDANLPGGLDDCATALGSDRFSFGGKTLRVTSLFVDPNGALNMTIGTAGNVPVGLRTATLRIGGASGTSYPMSSGFRKLYFWSNGPSWSDNQQVTIELLAPSDTPTVTAGDTQLAIDWTEPADTGGRGATITGYDIEYQITGAATWTQHTHNGTSTNATITRLINETTYNIRVRAKNAVGSSDWVIVSGTPSKPKVTLTARPNPVLEGSSVTVTALLSRALSENLEVPLTITTDNAEDDDFGSLTSITITAGSTSANGTITTNHDTDSEDEDFIVVVGTLPSTVVAGTPSSASVTITDVDPGRPTGLNVTAGDAQLSLSWTAPSDTGAPGASLAGYDVEYKTTAAANWTPRTHASTGTTSSITGLSNDTSYKVRVRARNAAGVSGWVEGSGTPSKTRVTLAATPNPVDEGSPVTVTATLSRSLSGSVSIPLTITRDTAEAGDIGTLTTITVSSGSTSGTGTITTAEDAGIADERFTVALGSSLPSSVAAGTPYSVTIRIIDDDPGPPTGLNVSAGDTKLSLSWTAPTDTGSPGASLAGYDVQYKVSTAADWTDFTHSGTGTTSEITGLANGTTYSVRVRAKNAAGVSEWVTGSGTPSKPTVTLTADPNPVAEGASVTVTATLSRALAANLEVPVTITAGTAEPGDIGTLTTITVSSGSTSGTGTITTAQDTDIADETFTVALGSLPATVAAGTPDPISVKIIDDDPGPPTDFEVSAGDRSLSLSWTAPTDTGAPGVSLAGYDVEYKVSTAADWIDSTHSGTGTTSEITGLANGTTYSVRIRAKNASGVSEWVTGSGTPSQSTVSLAAVPNPVAEGSSVTVTVSLSRTVTGDVVVPITVTRGSSEDGDIGTLTTITVSSGSISATGTITTAQDTDSADETFTVALGSLPSTVVAGTPNSATVTITDDDPGAPTDLDVTAGDAKLSLSWTAPTRTGPSGVSLAGYDVEYKVSTAADWTDLTHAGIGTTASITGLVNDTVYDVRVRARNESGVSVWVTGLGVPVDVGDASLRLLRVTRTDAVSTVVPFTPRLTQGTEFVVRVDADVSEVKAWATPTVASAVVSIDGVVGTSKVVSLDYGDNTITVVVTAVDGVTSKTYTITAKRAHPIPTIASVTEGAVGTSPAVTVVTTNPDAAVYNVVVQIKTVSAVSWPERTTTHSLPSGVTRASGTANSHVFTGLTKGTAYLVRAHLVTKSDDTIIEASSSQKAFTAWNNPDAPGGADTVVWSTTLTVDADDGLLGCENTDANLPGGLDDCSSAFSDAFRFSFGGKTLRVTALFVDADNNLHLTIATSGNVPQGLRDTTLRIGGESFPMTSGFRKLYLWENGPTWVDNQQVTVELLAPSDTPTVTAGDTKLTVAWQEPADAGGRGATISGYDIQHKTTDATNWTPITHTGTTTTAEITSLMNGTTYNVRVRAKNAVGESAWITGSATLGKPTLTLTAAPNPVTEGSSVTVTVTLSRALTANLVIPITITRGSAEAGDVGSLTSITINSGATSATGTITTAQDTDSADETFTVALGTLPATVAAGAPNSATVTITDDDPGVPTGLGVSAGDAKLSLSWTAPTDTGAAGVSLSGYDIQYKTADATNWTSKTHTGTGTTSEITSLVNGTTYDVRVRAKNSSGVSEWVSGSGTPGKPTVSLTAAPNPVAEGSSVTVTATLSRALTSNLVVPITVTRGSAEAGDVGSLTSITINSGATSATGTITTAQDTDSADETFTVALGTLPTSVAAGAPNSASVTITDDDPGVPTGLGVSAGDAKLSLSWTAPTDTGAAGVSLSGYDIQYKTADATNWTSKTHTGTGTTSEITSLVNGTTYDVRVRAKNSSGVSEWVSGSGTPGKPTVTLTAAPNPVAEGSSVTVTATLSRALTSNLVVPITVTRGSAEAGDVGSLTSITINSGATSATGTITTAQDTDSADETFTVALGTLPATVAAGAPNSASMTITDDDPGVPTGLGVSAGDAKLSLSWTAPTDTGAAGVSLTGYDIQYKTTAAADWSTKTHTGTTTSAEITSLVNGTTYQVRVRAKNSAGVSSWVSGSGVPVDLVDASLRLLRVTQTDAGYTVVPFTPRLTQSTSFTVRVDADVSEVKVWATPTVASAVVSIDGTVGTSKTVSLDYGDNTIRVVVTAVDGVTTKTYTITAKRAHPIPSVDSVTEGAVSASPAVTVTTTNPDAAVYNVVVQIKTVSAVAWPERGTAHSLPSGVSRASGTDSRHVFTNLTKGTAYLVRAHLVTKSDSTIIEASSSQKAFTAWNDPGPPGGADIVVWSTTLTVDSDDGLLGCENTDQNQPGGLDDCSGAYSDAFRFSFGGKTLRVTALFVDADGALHLTIATSGNVPQGLRDTTLRIGGASYPMTSGFRKLYLWENGPTWVDNQQVTVELLAPSDTPTVTAGDTKLTVSWREPTDTGGRGATISGYDIEYQENDAADWTPITHSGTTTTSEITGLTNGTTYNVRVRAKNAVGESTWITASATLGKPTVTLTAAPNPVAEGSSVTVTATLSRALTSNLVVPITVTRGSAEAGDVGSLTSITINSGATSATGTITTAQDTDSADETFTVALGTLPTTVAAGAPNSASITITDDDPGVPTGLGVSAGDAKLSLSWTAPTDTGAAGVSLTGYDVQYKTTAAADWSTKTHSGTTTSAEITSLVNGTTYDVQVRAKNSSGVSQWVSGSGTPGKPTVSLTAAPNPVAEGSSVTVTATVSRALTANLVVPITVTRGSAEAGDVGSLTSITINSGATSATGTITTAQDTDSADETFTVALGTLPTTVAAGAPNSASITITDDDPGVPTGLGVSAGDAKLSLSWTAPTDTGAAGVSLTGYDVQYKTTAAADWSTKTHSGTTTSAEITSLVNGTTYDVQVRAKNSSGVSQWVSGSGTPGKPTVSLTAAPNPVAEGSSVTVTATVSRALTANLVVPITVTRGSAEAGDVGTLTSITISSGSTSATGTITTNQDTDSADETFTVALGTLPTTVAAGAPNSASITITDDDPGPPTGLNVNAGDAKLNLSWTAPTRTGPSGVSLTGYDVQYKTSAAGTWSTKTHTGTGTTSEITGLANGTTYQVQVRAKNSAGVSQWVSGSGTPSKPAVTLTVAPNPVAEGSSVTVTVTVSRAVTGNVVVPITVTRGSAEAGDVGSLTSITINSGATSATGTITTAQDTDSADETFTVALGTLPTTVAAGAPNSATVTITDDDPGVPTGLGVSAGDAKLSLSWTAPTDTGAAGVSLTGYDIQYKTTAAADWSTKTHTGTTTSAEITSLVNGTTYDVQVRAKNGSGVSQWVSGSGTPGKPTVTLTAAPNPVAEGSSVTVTATLSRALTANLVVPITITRGSAEAGDVGSLTSITINSGATSATGTITTAQDTDSADETFTVALGTLPTTVAAGTPNSATVTITDDDPGPPTGLNVNAGDTKLALSWTAPTDTGAQGASLTGYDIQYKTTAAAEWTDFTHTGTGTTASITGLVNGTTYNVQVRAKNSSGVSQWVSGSGTPSTTTVTPTVTLAAAPNPVAEGSSVTVTVTVSRALASNLSVPLTVTRGSAEAGDIGTLTSITINSGSTSATGTIATNQDTDSADETFTVTFGSLPTTVAAGTPNSATVTITDDDPGTPTDLDVTAGDTKLLLSWTAPSDTGAAGVSLAGYDVQYKTTAAAEWTDFTHTGTGTTAEITGLVNDTAYDVRVRARNASGVSVWVTGLGVPVDVGDASLRLLRVTQTDAGYTVVPFTPRLTQGTSFTVRVGADVSEVKVWATPTVASAVVAIDGVVGTSKCACSGRCPCFVVV